MNHHLHGLKLVCVAALAATAMFCPAANADGLPEPHYGPPAVGWTGFYFGVNAGGAWPDSRGIRLTGTDTGSLGLGSDIADGTAPSHAPLDWSKSFTGGAQAGYNRQLGGMVLGWEADIQWFNGHAEFIVTSTNPQGQAVTTSAAREMNMLATVRGRIGAVVWERSLFYVTGGLAIGDATLKVSSSCSTCDNPRDVTSASARTPVGWVVGGGYEAALTNRISLKAEYLHYDLGENHTTTTFDYPGNTSSMTGKVRDDGNIVRVGVNFRLDTPAETSK